MAVEAKRGCGWRTVGGIYLVGGGQGAPCDRLPLPIEPCPVCGEEVRFTRGIQRIDPLKLWGDHADCKDDPTCPICQPSARAGIAPTYLMWVGSDYTVPSFLFEAARMGVSKRIPAIPIDFVVGESWVLLAKDRLLKGAGRDWVPGVREPRPGGIPGVFHAFRPERIEKIITDRDAQSGFIVDGLVKQGITPVVVPASDPDHNPVRRKR